MRNCKVIVSKIRVSLRTVNKRRNVIDVNFIRQNPVVYKYEVLWLRRNILKNYETVYSGRPVSKDVPTDSISKDRYNHAVTNSA
jgi:hypothetical protein